MHVLFIIGQLGRGGAEQQLYHLATTLPAETSIVVMRKNDPNAFWTTRLAEKGIPVIEVARRGALDPARLHDLVRVIRDQNPDLIHIFADNVTAVYARIAAMLAGPAPVVVSVRRHPGDEPVWFCRLKRHVLNPRIAALIANAKSTADYLTERRLLPPDRIHSIPNGLDTERFRRPVSPVWPPGLPTDWRKHPVVGMVTSLQPKKNPQLFVQVAALVLESMPEARFIHVGKGPLLVEVQQQAQAAGIADKIIFLGERGDIPQLLHTMSVFVLTSDSEGTPNAVMEALAAGLPCVVTDVGDCRALVQHDVSGYVAAPGDAAALADGLLTLLRDDNLRRQMGQAALTHIQRYSIDSMTQAYLDIYRRILADAAGRKG